MGNVDRTFPFSVKLALAIQHSASNKNHVNGIGAGGGSLR